MKLITNKKTGIKFKSDDKYAIKRYVGYPDIFEVEDIEPKNEEKKVEKQEEVEPKNEENKKVK